jgi:dTDP-4-dehydrorhamnose reductase
VAPEPGSIYGLTKLEAECHVLTYRRGLVVRFPLMYGLPDVARAPTFFETLVASLRAGKPVSLFEDEVRTPLWLDDAARACLKLGESELGGVIHAGGPERLSRFEMGERVVEALHADPSLLVRTRREQLQAPEARARDVSLDNPRYRAEFGEAVGMRMRESLPLVFAPGPSRLLS